MPAATDASVTRAGEALRFAGALSRAHVPALWKQLPALEGVTTLDLEGVASVDSAGLALLAEIAARASDRPIILSLSKDGAPAGLAELRSAYRLDAGLGYGAA